MTRSRPSSLTLAEQFAWRPRRPRAGSTMATRLFLLVLTAWRVSSCSTPRCEDEQWRSALQDELYAIGRSDDWSELADDALAPFVSPFELCVLALYLRGDFRGSRK